MASQIVQFEDFLPTLLYIGIVISFAWVGYILLFKKPESESSNEENEENKGKEPKSKKKGIQPVGNKKKQRKDSEKENEEQKFTHPWLLTTLKGHGSSIMKLAYSPNGKFLASAANDRSILLWITKDLFGEHKQIRVNVEFDSANQICWSPDNKGFVISRHAEMTLEAFKLGKKPDGSIGNIQAFIKFKQVHKGKIVGLGIACNGTFMMSCSDDNKLVIWDLKGTILSEIDTYLGKTHLAKVSPCGRFVGVSGFSREVTIYKIKFNTSGNFEEISKAYQLKGHNEEVCSFDFSQDSSFVATVSRDGKWRLFDTTGNRVNERQSGDLGIEIEEDQFPTIALSHDSRLIAIGIGDSIQIYSAIRALHMGEISSVHSTPISHIVFSPDDKLFMSAGDKTVRIFNNLPGLEEKVKDLKEQIKDTSSSNALKNRLTNELQQSQKELAELKKKI